MFQPFLKYAYQAISLCRVHLQQLVKIYPNKNIHYSIVSLNQKLEMGVQHLQLLGKCKLKPLMRYHYTPIRTAIFFFFFNQILVRIHRNRISHTLRVAVLNVKWCSAVESSLAVLCKTKCTRHTTQHSHSWVFILEKLKFTSM